MLKIIVTKETIANLIADAESQLQHRALEPLGPTASVSILTQAILSHKADPVRIAQIMSRMAAHAEGVKTLDIVNTEVISDGTIACSFNDGNSNCTGVYIADR
jgi:hypothetical protein